jgi:Lsr2
MARETIIRLSDDLDGGEAVEELTFALRGVEYEIDLSAKNVTALEKALEKFIMAGRKVSRRTPSPGRRSAATAPKEDLTAIREWAKANGYRVADRGRVSTEVRDAFYATNG